MAPARSYLALSGAARLPGWASFAILRAENVSSDPKPGASSIMSPAKIPDDLVKPQGGRIVLVVLDGLGGLPHPTSGLTELEAARTPNLDALAARSSLGMLIPVAPGVTPGSGPGHLALFGYHPMETVIGRGALSALGVGFELRPGDLAVRLNLATLDGDGRVVDRRAGRPSDAVGQAAVDRLREGFQEGLGLPAGGEIFVEHEKEHRAVLVLRAPGLDERLRDTDPQVEGVAPHAPEALDPAAKTASELLIRVLTRAREVLADGDPISGVLARGYAVHRGLPGLQERFGLKGVAIARYPMYRGVARLVGMEIAGPPNSDQEAVEILARGLGDFDFHFLHHKAPDARGEDGDFDAKVASIEAADRWMEEVAALDADVLMVTGDHSTPAAMAYHSWHAVPALIRSPWARPSAKEFGESACRAGELGILEARHLMSLALAHAGRLEKFGA